jgi:hypothetical protein
MIITDIKEFKIQYDESLRLLRVEWAAGSDMRRFRPAMEQLYQVALRLQVTHGLLDIDTLPDISAYDQIWLGSHWLPKTRQMALKQAIIVLSSAQVYNQQAVETLLFLSRLFIKFDFQFFTQSTPALHWLYSDSPRLPEMLSEWADTYGPSDSEVTRPRARYFHD